MIGPITTVSGFQFGSSTNSVGNSRWISGNKIVEFETNLGYLHYISDISSGQWFTSTQFVLTPSAPVRYAIYTDDKMYAAVGSSSTQIYIMRDTGSVSATYSMNGICHRIIQFKGYVLFVGNSECRLFKTDGTINNKYISNGEFTNPGDCSYMLPSGNQYEPTESAAFYNSDNSKVLFVTPEVYNADAEYIEDVFRCKVYQCTATVAPYIVPYGFDNNFVFVVGHPNIGEDILATVNPEILLDMNAININNVKGYTHIYNSNRHAYIRNRRYFGILDNGHYTEFQVSQHGIITFRWAHSGFTIDDSYNPRINGVGRLSDDFSEKPTFALYGGYFNSLTRMMIPDSAVEPYLFLNDQEVLPLTSTGLDQIKNRSLDIPQAGTALLTGMAAS